nr:hypothetical protein [Pedobacter panaciterrae]
MKKHIFYILLIGGFCGLLLFTLTFSREKHPNNGFNRNFIDVKLQQKKVLDLQSSSFIFIGSSDTGVLLRNFEHPTLMYRITKSSKNIDTISLKVPSDFNTTAAYTNITVLQPYSYLTNSSGSIIMLHKNINFKIPNTAFDQSCAISSNSIIVRVVKTNNGQKQRQLTKLVLSKGITIAKEFALPKQVDGFFCTDGQLSFNAKHSKLFYTYFYRGNFLCLDTNLQLLYESKTIDTVHRAKIKLGVTTSRFKDGTILESTILTDPSNLVNDFYTSNGDKIYILSALSADNEKVSIFDKKQSIDVYSEKEGKYLYSFNIPRYKGYKLDRFIVSDNSLSAIFNTFLVTYSINNAY